MLSAVIIILREALEAALIISVLLASSKNLLNARRWLIGGMAFGLLGSLLIASNMGSISEALEGTGQELLNTVLLVVIIIATGIYLCSLVVVGSVAGENSGIDNRSLNRVALVCMITIVALASMREGAEILIYLSVFIVNLQESISIIVGAAIGLGIGLSIGALFYLCIAYLDSRKRRTISNVILILVASGMASEAALFLIQAGYLPSEAPLWDSSDLLAEHSVIGQLLYALVAYEATPTLIQVVTYLGTFLVLTLLIVFVERRISKKAK